MNEADKIISDVVKGLEEFESIRHLSDDEYARLRKIQHERQVQRGIRKDNQSLN